MGRSANGLKRKEAEREKPGVQGSSRDLDLDALRQTPGFMIRILQLLNFEAFFGISKRWSCRRSNTPS